MAYWAFALLAKAGEITLKESFGFKSSWSALTKFYTFSAEDKKILAFFLPKIASAYKVHD